MPLPDPSLEPAIRDPKKLRNTALVLVAMMLMGGTLIMLAYNQWSKQQSKDDRPAVVYRITPERDLTMLRQDGKTVNLGDLKKQVVALNVISLRDPQVAERSMAVMKRLAASRAENPDFKLVTLVLDPSSRDQLEAMLTGVAKEQGMNLPQWWVGSTTADPLLKFIYNQLKATVSPYEKDGKWEYDPSIVLIDKNSHLRRAVVPQKQGGPSFIANFDFEQAAAWDAKGVKTGTEHDNVQQLEVLLNHTIDKLVAEPPAEEKGTFDNIVVPLIALLLLGSTFIMVAFHQRRKPAF